MINTIILGHALNVLPKLPAESINCCVCSPPYWSLRDYGIDPVIWDGDKNCKHIWGNKTITLKHKSGETNPDKEGWFKDRGASNDKGNCFCLKCGAWKGSLGLEPTFELYIEHLCQIFDEVKRVLRKDGTCWVNIGDSYGGTQGKNAGWPDSKTRAKVPQQLKPKQYAKSLLDIPYRFSIEMINRGWIKRNTIIWWKPNCMPSSADDRFTIDFEYLFFFTKNSKTLFWTNEKTLECVDKKPLGTKGKEGVDWERRRVGVISENSFNVRVRDANLDKYSQKATEEEKKNYKKPKFKKVSLWTGHDYWFDQQFEDISEATIKRAKYNWCSPGTKSSNYPNGLNRNEPYKNHINFSLGRNKRCVWIIPTRPFPEAHFAVYPEGLIEIPIKAGCPEFICKKCGKARVKILEPTKEYKKLLGKSWHPHKHDAERGMSETPDKKVSCTAEYKSKGYSNCGCNAGFESGIVLDPFMGAGTTALVALKQRKRFVGIEIKQEYIDMAKRRIKIVQPDLF